MRTTLTLDEDVAAKLKSEVRRSGKSFREAVNEALRVGLLRQPAAARGEGFRIRTRDLGELRPGLSLDNVAALIEQVEGDSHR